MEFLRILIQSIAYLLLVYYLFIIIYFIMTWIPPLYRTKFFNFFRKATSPFMNICSGKLIVGSFDIGATLGVLLYYAIVQILFNISNMI